MSLLLYQVFLWVYEGSIRTYALLDSKAASWVNGRKSWRRRLRADLPSNESRIWMHCSSLGEFEQGRPVLEAIRQSYSSIKIVLTFFSPSGYEIARSFSGADYIYYLPMDGKASAEAFLDLVQPRLIVFVKYEFWYYYLMTAKKRQIPSVLISAAFRPGQAFFKPFGGLFRSMLRCFSLIFVQDEASKILLHGIGLDRQVRLGGDTRYDRVASIARLSEPVPEAAAFCTGHEVLVAGSTWPEDEAIIAQYLPFLPSSWKIILAPHEIDATHVSRIQHLFGEKCALFSAWKGRQGSFAGPVLVIDNIGMLSRLYAYGNLAYIGGGFQKGGIHNVLEPAVFGLPIVFGPVYDKFVEAVQLHRQGMAFAVKDGRQALEMLQKLVADQNRRERISQSLRAFVEQNVGATGRIMDAIAQRKWLVN